MPTSCELTLCILLLLALSKLAYEMYPDRFCYERMSNHFRQVRFQDAPRKSRREENPKEYLSVAGDTDADKESLSATSVDNATLEDYRSAALYDTTQKVQSVSTSRKLGSTGSSGLRPPLPKPDALSDEEKHFSTSSHI